MPPSAPGERAPLRPLLHRCPECGAKRHAPCKSERKETRPHAARLAIARGIALRERPPKQTQPENPKRPKGGKDDTENVRRLLARLKRAHNSENVKQARHLERKLDRIFS